MRTSCITHPAKEHFLVIHQWQIKACDGNACAAALLSFFEGWHNTRLDIVEQSQNVTDNTMLAETLWQNHTEEEIEKGIFIYKRTAIAQAIKLLEDKGFIQRGKNPDKRYSFDRTRFFLFNADIVNEWINPKNGTPSTENNGWTNQKQVLSDQPKTTEQYSITPNTLISTLVAKAPVDIRFQPFLKSLDRYWKNLPNHQGRPLPVGGDGGKLLKEFLKNYPDIDEPTFERWLEHMAASDDKVSAWNVREIIYRVHRYADGPLDKFSKPKEPPKPDAMSKMKFINTGAQ